MAKGKRSPPRKDKEIVSCGLELIGRRLERALCDECELDKLIEIVRKSDIAASEKTEVVQMLKGLRMPDIKVIASIVESVRKNAAAEEGQTHDEIEIKLPKGAEEYAE